MVLWRWFFVMDSPPGTSSSTEPFALPAASSTPDLSSPQVSEAASESLDVSM